MAKTESEAVLGEFKVICIPQIRWSDIPFSNNTYWNDKLVNFNSYDAMILASMYEYNPDQVRAIAYIDPETGIMNIMCNGDVNPVSTYTHQYSGESATSITMLSMPTNDTTIFPFTTTISNTPWNGELSNLPYSFYNYPYVDIDPFNILRDSDNINVIQVPVENPVRTPIKDKTLYDKLTPNDYYSNYVGNNVLSETDCLDFGNDNFIINGGINQEYAGKKPAYNLHFISDVIANAISCRKSGSAPSVKQSNYYPYVEGIYITDNFEQAKDYIDNGIIGDKIYYTEPSDDSDFSNEDGTNGRFGDNQDLNTPINSAQAINGTNLYLLSTSEMQSLVEWFNDSDISQILENFITGKYNNLAQAIISIMDFPVKSEYLGASESMSNIIVATKNTGINVHSLKSTPPIVLIGSISLDDTNFKGLHGGSFVDYAPLTDVMIYLPIAGWQKLDANLCMYSTIKVYALFDALTGKVTYFIKSEKGGVSWLVNIFEAKFATSLSFTLENATQTLTSLYSNIANATVSSASAIATMNPFQVAQSALGFGYNGSPSISVAGQAGEQAGIYSPKKCGLLVKSPSYNRPKNYGHHIGYPCMKERKLKSKDLKGLTICENPYIKFDEEYPTNEEVEEIYNLLTEGVYL